MAEEKFVCKRCGLCCMVCDMSIDEITTETQNSAIDKMRWLNLHRCDTQIRTMKDGRRYTVLRIPLICIQLDQDKEGKYFCKDYERRPEICRKFFCQKAKQEGTYSDAPKMGT